MSDTNNQKVYVNGLWINEKVFSDGGSILKLAILPDKFIESIKSLKKDENGYVRIVIAKSKNPQNNSTHYCYWDNYQPANKPSQPSDKTDKPNTKAKTKQTKPVENQTQEPQDEPLI